MRGSESAEAVAHRVSEAIAQGQALDYAADMPDNDYPEIYWSIYGLPVSGEIVVVARIGELRLGKADLSPLLIPEMSERVFGIDVRDEALAKQLSDELWAEQSGRLERSSFLRVT